jgi:hypothetical protein
MGCCEKNGVVVLFIIYVYFVFFIPFVFTLLLLLVCMFAIFELSEKPFIELGVSALCFCIVCDIFVVIRH